jgi:transposase-like protein
MGNAEKQEVGRGLNNRVENSHLSFRRRERAMLRFRQMKTLHKFSSVMPSSATTSTTNGILLIAEPTSFAAQPR